MTHDGNYQADSDGVAGEELRSFIERAERMNEEIKALNDDKKEIFAEARGRGFDVAAIKEIIKLRAADPAERAERSAILELYLSALGEA
jgi:uncharacterized protein (UPF0335 family)